MHANNEAQEDSVQCPVACYQLIKLSEYVDHTLECEKIIDNCMTCGPEYLRYDIHPGHHSSVPERLDCTECVNSIGKK